MYKCFGGAKVTINRLFLTLPPLFSFFANDGNKKLPPVSSHTLSLRKWLGTSEIRPHRPRPGDYPGRHRATATLRLRIYQQRETAHSPKQDKDFVRLPACRLRQPPRTNRTNRTHPHYLRPCRTPRTVSPQNHGPFQQPDTTIHPTNKRNRRPGTKTRTTVSPLPTQS